VWRWRRAERRHGGDRVCRGSDRRGWARLPGTVRCNGAVRRPAGWARGGGWAWWRLCVGSGARPRAVAGTEIQAFERVGEGHMACKRERDIRAWAPEVYDNFRRLMIFGCQRKKPVEHNIIFRRLLLGRRKCLVILAGLSMATEGNVIFAGQPIAAKNSVLFLAVGLKPLKLIMATEKHFVSCGQTFYY
jgi:hypothetical protein